jgi:hypothetical protein
MTLERQGFPGIAPDTSTIDAIRFPKYPIPTAAGRTWHQPFRDSVSARRRRGGGVSGFETVGAGVERGEGSETSENVNRLFGIPKNRFTRSNIATKFEPSEWRREVRKTRFELRDVVGAFRKTRFELRDVVGAFRKTRFELRDVVGAFRPRPGWTPEPNSTDTPWVFHSKSESFVSKSESNSIEFESVISKRESNERNLTQVAGDPRRRPGDLHAVASARFKLAPTRIQRSHQ